MRGDEPSFSVLPAARTSAESIPKPADTPSASTEVAMRDYLLRHCWWARV